jgi:hypothetical protein
MPRLAPTSSVTPSRTNGSWRTVSSFCATATVASGREETLGSSTANSSPPSRATVSLSRSTH